MINSWEFKDHTLLVGSMKSVFASPAGKTSLDNSSVDMSEIILNWFVFKICISRNKKESINKTFLSEIYTSISKDEYFTFFYDQKGN